jgi:hypothetical protein
MATHMLFANFAQFLQSKLHFSVLSHFGILASAEILKSEFREYIS